MVLLAEKYEWECIKSLKQFFKNTHTVNQVIQRTIDSDKDVNVQTLLLEQFEPQDYMDIVSERYKENTLRCQELFRFLVSGMDANSREFNEYKQLILEKEGLKISGRIFVDYEKLEQEGKQKYFDSLFNKDDFEHLLYELIDLSGNNEIVYEELRKVSFKLTRQRYDLKKNSLGYYSLRLERSNCKEFFKTYKLGALCYS